MTDVKAVSLGDSFSAAIKNDGSLWMWGWGQFGALDNGATESVYAPKKVMDGVAAVSLGMMNSAVVKSDGSLWMCGLNREGQVNANAPTQQNTFVRVMGDVAKEPSESAPAPATTKTFPDVASGSWYAGVVSRAAGLGLISGYADGRFGPADKVTRGQVAAILWNMAGKPAAGSGVRSFPDVAAGKYYSCCDTRG